MSYLVRHPYEPEASQAMADSFERGKLSFRMVKALRSGVLHHQTEGWTKLRTLAKYLRVKEESVLAVAASSQREDGEWYFLREIDKDTNTVWISAIESRQAAEAREAREDEADAAGGVAYSPTSPGDEAPGATHHGSDADRAAKAEIKPEMQEE